MEQTFCVWNRPLVEYPSYNVLSTVEFVRKKPACVAEAIAKGDLFNVLGCGTYIILYQILQRL
jgi:hypothetical protein